MFKRSIFAISALALSSSLFAAAPTNPFVPTYKVPAFTDIHQGEGAMTQDHYMNYVNRSWIETGGKDINKSHPKYSEYQKSPRFGLMDKDGDGSISQNEYMGFHQDAWASTKKQTMTSQDFEAWSQDSNNPLHPSYKKN